MKQGTVKYESQMKQTLIYIFNIKHTSVEHKVYIITIITIHLFQYSYSHKSIRIKFLTGYVVTIFLVGSIISCSCIESAMKNSFIMIDISFSTDGYHINNMCWGCFITLTHLCCTSSFAHCMIGQHIM